MTTITTWEEMKVRVWRMHWEIRLKDDNKTHRWKENGAAFLFGAWIVVFYLVSIYIYQSEYVSMVRWVALEKSHYTLAFKVRWCEHTYFFYVHSQKSCRICDQLVVNFEPWNHVLLWIRKFPSFYSRGIKINININNCIYNLIGLFSIKYCLMSAWARNSE